MLLGYIIIFVVWLPFILIPLNRAFPHCNTCGKRFFSNGKTFLCPHCKEEMIRKQKAEDERRRSQRYNHEFSVVNSINNDDKNERVVPMEFMGRRRSYVYQNVKLYIVPGQEPNFSLLEPGEDVTLEKEPSNSYDSKAVYARTWLVSSNLPDTKVGYIRKGKLQDMINDYLDRRLPIMAYIDSIDDDEGIITLCLAFYRDLVDFDDIDIE